MSVLSQYRSVCIVIKWYIQGQLRVSQVDRIINVTVRSLRFIVTSNIFTTFSTFKNAIEATNQSMINHYSLWKYS